MTKEDRITPAYAGKSCFTSNSPISAEDHPRLCGEKCQILCATKGVTGSPPPMRGKAVPLQLPHDFSGITPAYAGKRQDVQQPQKREKDHPRLCGEKNLLHTQFGIVVGSPPPMRGKVICIQKKIQIIGITPAYAGKSFKWSERKHIAKDHPRLCGEKYTRSLPYLVQRGSPPPMRGKVHRFRVFLSKPRITPAYAGKSFFFVRSLNFP